MSSKYVEPPESDGDKYTKDSIATEKQKSGSPVEYNYNKSDIERDASVEEPSAQSYATKQPATSTEPQYSPSQPQPGTVRQYEQPVEQYNAPAGYESNADSSANQQLYDSNYATEVQPKYDEQPYDQYAQQPYDQTYDAGVYDQQQYDQQPYDQQQYDPQQYDANNQQYDQYPTNYDTNYTNQTAYQSEQQQPTIDQPPLTEYIEPAPSSGPVGQEYTGTRIEPKTPTARQQPQLLPKQSPQA